jgi:tetratricopeptide (TPR) repeat protein
VPVSDALTPLYARGLFLFAAPMPLLALGAAWMLRRRRDRLAADVALARSTRARKEARKRLAASERFLKAGQSAEFHAEVARAVLQYIGDKLNVSPSGLTHDGLRQRLDAAGASEDLRERLVQVLEHCDAARFAPGGVSAERMRNLLTEVESLVMEIEQSWNRKTARFAVVTLALLCTALAWSPGAQAEPPAGTTAQAAAQAGTAAPVPGTSAAQPAPGTAPAPTGTVHVQQEPGAEFAPPQELLSRGNAAYEAGHFAEAIEAYTSAEHLGVRNGPLYYNLGNAYYKSGNLGGAIACYRRAERLMPRDPLLRSNLEFALSRREDKAVHPPMPWPIAAARAVFRWMNLNEWIVVTTGLYALACGLGFLVYIKRLRRLPVRLAFYAMLSLFLLAAAILLYKAHDERAVQRGVIGVDKAAVVSGPGADYTVEFWVHAGTEVTIEDRRPDWLRVSLGGKLEGWIPTQSVEPI